MSDNQITLNDVAARQWLQQMATAAACGEYRDMVIDDHWKAWDPQETDTVILLLAGAQAKGIIGGLHERVIGLIVQDHARHLVLTIPARATNTSPITLLGSLPIIDGQDPAGIDSAVHLLRQAVDVANRLARQLQEHARGYVLVVRDPDRSNQYTVDGDVVTVDIDLGNNFDTTPDDEETAIGFVEELGAQLDEIPFSSPVLVTALFTYSTAVEGFPTATAIVEAYLTTRRNTGRQMWALQAADGSARRDAAICSTCLPLPQTLQALTDEHAPSASGELTEATDLSDLTCRICGYQHQPTA